MHLIHIVLRMINLHTVCSHAIWFQVHGEVYHVSVSSGIGCISDVLLVKAIIAILLQQRGDASALIIKYVNIHIHPLAEQSRSRVLMHVVPDLGIRNVIADSTHLVCPTRLDAII